MLDICIVSVPIEIYNKEKRVYCQYNPTIRRTDNDILLIYSIDELAKIVDQFDLSHTKFVEIQFLDSYIDFEKDTPVHVTSYKQKILQVKHIKRCLLYNSVDLVKFLTSNEDESSLLMWINIALGTCPSFWPRIARLYFNGNESIKDQVMYLQEFAEFKDDSRFEQYMIFMNMTKLDIVQAQLRRDIQYKFPNIIRTAIASNNYKIVKHFITEYINNHNGNDIFLDIYERILDSIFVGHLYMTDLLIDLYMKLHLQIKYDDEYLYNFRDLLSSRNGKKSISIESLAYFHSILNIVDFSHHGGAEKIIIKLITISSKYHHLRVQFAYLVTGFPYEAGLCRHKVKGKFHKDLINKVTLLD